MLALTWPQSLSTFLFLTICVLLVLLILIQKGRGGGLSGAFGGVGSYSPFGTKTGDALTWATVILTGLYLLMAVLTNYAYHPTSLSGLSPAVTAPSGQPQSDGTGSSPAGDVPADAAPANPEGSTATPPATPAGTAETPAPAPATDQPAPTAPPASQPAGN